jgi:hypothetical protein
VSFGRQAHGTMEKMVGGREKEVGGGRRAHWDHNTNHGHASRKVPMSAVKPTAHCQQWLNSIVLKFPL